MQTWYLQVIINFTICLNRLLEKFDHTLPLLSTSWKTDGSLIFGSDIVGNIMV